MKHALELDSNITIFQTLVTGLITERDKCIGAITSLDVKFFAKSIVVTTGTFLRALKLLVKTNQKEEELETMSRKDFQVTLKN